MLCNGSSVITFDNVNFWNASLELEGVLSAIDLVSLSVNVSMTNCSFVGEPILFVSFLNPINFTMSNCYFQQALEISSTYKHSSKMIKFLIKDSMFCDNYIVFNHKSEAFSTVFAEQKYPLLSFENVSFINMSQALLVHGPVNLTVDDCFFERNRGSISPVLLYHVNLFFHGMNTTFYNNVSNTGGAIHLSSSTLWITDNVTVSFVNNTAMQVGGAIFVTEDAAEVIDDAVFDIETMSSDCFYQLTSNPETPGLLGFENNSALYNWW